MRLGAIALVVLLVASCVAQVVRGPKEYTPAAVELKGRPLDKHQHDAKRVSISLPYPLSFTSGKGELLYLGTTHTYDPADPQITSLQERFAAFKPTVALVEGRPDVMMQDLPAMVKKSGESGALYWLASQGGVPVYTLEPSREVEGKYLLDRHSRERVAVYLCLRTYLSNRRTRAITDGEVESILKRRQQQYGLAGTIRDVAHLDQLWAAEFPAHKGWRTMEEREQWPDPDGSWLNKIAKHANEVRDEHFLKTMIDLTRKGERVIAVTGCSHTIILEPVLRATFAN